jgi:hypothetical protein
MRDKTTLTMPDHMRYEMVRASELSRLRAIEKAARWYDQHPAEVMKLFAEHRGFTVLHDILAGRSPKLTPETVRERIARSGKDSAELDAHLRQTFTAPDNDTVLDSCGYPHKAEPAPVERVECDRCGDQETTEDMCAGDICCRDQNCGGRYRRK